MTDYQKIKDKLSTKFYLLLEDPNKKHCRSKGDRPIQFHGESIPSLNLSNVHFNIISSRIFL